MGGGAVAPPPQKKINLKIQITFLHELIQNISVAEPGNRLQPFLFLLTENVAG